MGPTTLLGSIVLAVLSLTTHAVPLDEGAKVRVRTTAATGGFPSLGFQVPETVPSSLEGWWADEETEYAFLGFSYDVSQCKWSPS